MDALMKLSREAQIVLGGGVVLLILSFLDWQQASYSVGIVSVSGGANEWHGIGILAALLVIVMLVWEGLRLLAVKVELGSLSPGLISVALALLVALFTVIAFFDKSTARHWPAWIGLIVALVVAAAALMRARGEGVQMPAMKAPPSS
ncbi:MAG TPA: hypothetical protein VKR79_02480 [Gaiellaceae bacterium]|nr:hypothetical protein [Gaiellaceae bacterium]